MSWNTNASEFVPGKLSFAPMQAKPQTQVNSQNQSQQTQPPVQAKTQTPVQPNTPVQTKTQTPEQPKTQQTKTKDPEPDSWEDVETKDTKQNEKKKETEEKKEYVESKAPQKKDPPKEYEKKEEEEDGEDQSQIIIEDSREHINVVFIGHVDAGKSTISGNILYLTGMVDDRTIEKYEKEAKDKAGQGWVFAYVMDTNEEEKTKGKTVEVGRAHFKTEKKRYTILDAPGHKNYVPNMIAGVAQADIGILVISARKGEFESGFDRNGQTREHAILAKTLGVKKLVVAVNKMDEATVNWSLERFEEIKENLGKWLARNGYNLKQDVSFVPISGYTGVNLVKPMDHNICPWWNGGSLINVLDELKPLERMDQYPLRIPVLDKYKLSGRLIVLGKVESGVLKAGDTLCINPGQLKVQVVEIKNEEGILITARPGENIRIVLKVGQVEEDSIYRGVVLSHEDSPPAVTMEFVGQIKILELLQRNPLFTAGYECVVHMHTAVEEVTITNLLDKLDKKGQSEKKFPKFVQNKDVVIAHMTLKRQVCMEKFDKFPQLGRFTLRDEGKTIGFGKIVAPNPPIKRKKQ